MTQSSHLTLLLVEEWIASGQVFLISQELMSGLYYNLTLNFMKLQVSS